jgi:hypothetical protein
MCGNHRAMKETLSVLLRYSNRDPHDPVPDHKDGHKIAAFLRQPEGRERYMAWQKEHHAMWKVLRGAHNQLASLACEECRGRGKVALFTSLADCLSCQTVFWEEREKRGLSWDEWKAQNRLVHAKKRIVGELLETPAGRKKLAAALEEVHKHGSVKTLIGALHEKDPAKPKG